MTPIYDPQNYDVNNNIAHLMGRVRMALHDAVDEELKPYDLTTAQFVVMRYLADGMASKAAEVCRAMTSDPGAMTRMIDRLERKGFVRRVRSVEDRRCAKLELTPEGSAVYPKLVAAAVGVLNRFLRGFSIDEVRQMEGLLGRMLANAKEL